MESIEATTHAVLLHDMDAKTGLDRATVARVVQRLLVCPYTEHPLDVRSTVVLEDVSTGRVVSTIHAEAWDDIVAMVPAEIAEDGMTVYSLDGFRVRTLDGRDLFVV